MKNSTSTFLLVLIASLFLTFSPANAATFTVTNTDDSGAGSLRQAILDANSTTDADVIEFSTSGTLTPATALPTITQSVTIDGTTATGYAAGAPTFHINFSGTALNVNASGVNIEGLDVSDPTGSQLGTGIIFSVSGGDNSIKNCTVQNRRWGIQAQGAGNVVIENNDLTGSGINSDSPALYLSIGGTVSASGNTFGGGSARGGLRIHTMADLSIGDENVSPTPDIVIESTSGFNTVGGDAIRVSHGSNISIDGVDVSQATGGSAGIGITLHVSGGDNSVKNCTIQNRRTGIKAEGSGNFVIENNDFTGAGGSGAALNLSVSASSTVSAIGNTFGGGNGNGLSINNMDGLSIGGENVSPTPDVVIESTSGFNTLTGTAISVSGSSNISIEGVDVSNTAGSQLGTGIFFNNSGGGDNSVKNCTVQNRRTGISAHGAGNFVIENNDLTGSGINSDYSALYLIAITGTVSASGNTFGGGSARGGLRIISMSDLSIGDENVSPTPNIVIESTSGLNTIGDDPIRITHGSNISIEGIDVSKTTGGALGTGLNLAGSNFTIQNVLINNRRNGIVLGAGGTNSITCSTFTNNWTAIQLTGTTTSTIENNTFACISTFAIDNNTGAAITAENNFWEDGSGPSNDGGTGESYDGDVDAEPFLSDVPLCAPGGANFCSNLVSWSVADITTDCESDGGTYDVCFTAADLGGVIGLDVTFSYPSQLTPVETNFITLKDLALNPVGGDASQIDVFENSSVEGEVSASVYFNSSAPLAAAWNGGGEFICFTFEMSETWDGTALTETITTTEIFESYETSVSAKGAEDATLEIITMIGQINVNGNESSPLVNGSAFNGTTEITTADENCTPDGRWTQGLNTDTDGGFSIAAGGSANVRITRNTAETDLAVLNGADALRAVFIRLGLGDAPTLNELLAMDVNGDGFASAGDITNILRRSVGLITDYPTQAGEVASDWKFALSADMDALEGGSYDWKTVPVLSQCMAVPEDACAETVEYDAVLKGDVVSSWTSGSNFKTAAETSLIVDVSAKHTLEMETTYRIPVYAQDIESFFTLDLDLPFDATKVSIEDVVLTEIGESYDIQFVWNTPEEGRLMMASYTIQEIDTNEPLFEIVVSEDITGAEFGAGTSYFNGIASNVEVIESTTVGIEDLLGGSNSLTAIQNIHPNPANNVVMINYSSKLSGNLQVQVMDLAGRTVAEQSADNTGRTAMDVSELQDGLYIVTLSENGELKGRAKLMVAK